MRLVILFVGLSLVAGCGLKKATDAVIDTPGKMDEMRRQLLETNESVRLQKVAIAKENLEKPENAKVLLPIPFGLMGYAKLFAENATTDEITGQIYLYLKEINSGKHTTAENPAGLTDKFTPAELGDINQYKQHRYTAAQAIAGLMPDAVTAKVIKEQIDGDGRYKNTSLSILMLRFAFLRDVMLSGSLLSEDMTDVGTLDKALEYASSMEVIARLPYVSQIKVSAKYLPPMEVYEESLDAESAKAYMRETLSTIKSRANAYQQKVNLASGQGTALQTPEQSQRWKNSVGVLDGKIAHWNKP